MLKTDTDQRNDRGGFEAANDYESIEIRMSELIGQKVMMRSSKKRGIIVDINTASGCMTVDFHGELKTFAYPAALGSTIILENQKLRNETKEMGAEAAFAQFQKKYSGAIIGEISYLRKTGGKRYRAIDGECISIRNGVYVYSFDTDTELHFPDGTVIKLAWNEGWVPAYVLSCEEFTLVFQTHENLGDKVNSIEFTSEPWQLMESLIDRIKEIKVPESPIAYMLACTGKNRINEFGRINLGQSYALRRASEEPITFIWGPPGTGKTTTLARIALEELSKGKRVLMLSYSNVSVDGALLKVADMSDYPAGKIIRYGYPRVKELLDSKTLTSYSYVLNKRPQLAEQYRELIERKKKLRRNDIKRTEINKELNAIRSRLLDYEKELVGEAAFVATTVSKAVVDKAIYQQKFDMVIFDEASMAYVPQIVFAAGLAKEHFCCLGDFRQLPAIVQNPEDAFLKKDIFEYTGITYAVENDYGHEWLVMLNEQFRMHPDIADFVSEHMYGGRLDSSPRITEHRQRIADCAPLNGEAMGIVDLSLTYSVCIRTNDQSRINLMSAMMCVRLAELLLPQFSVGIITPYSAQSRLILAMIRDLQEVDEKYKAVSCATVHQFQGSEKPVIIYDAVDCFRMAFPGVLLTSKKDNAANRLFNVALTRAQGKFLLVANLDYMFRKNISKDLMFTKALRSIDERIEGEQIYESLGTAEDETTDMFLGDRDEVDSWERYLKDIENAEGYVFMDVPGKIDKDLNALEELRAAVEGAHRRGVKVKIRYAEGLTLPDFMKKYAVPHGYVTNPITIVDQKVVWFGEPISAADFISEGAEIRTEYFPCMRFDGKHTARMLKAIFEFSY